MKKIVGIQSIKEALSEEKKFRIGQVVKAVFRDLIRDWGDATTLSLALREKLSTELSLDVKTRIYGSLGSKSMKTAFKFGTGRVEAVLMRHAGRNTVCVSSQAGCALACSFCATGQNGFMRDLSADEMVFQVLWFSRLLAEKEERVNNVVFMGMGEPFMNYDNVLSALRAMNDPDILGIGARRLSVSTVGVIPGIRRFAREDIQANLSVSLHAADNKLRSSLMPINNKYSLTKLLSSLADYITITGRKLTVEYVMLEGVNDSDNQARELAALLVQKLPKLFYVNLIRYNRTKDFSPSKKDRIASFRRILEKEGIKTVERYRFGADIKAACGQLASK